MPIKFPWDESSNDNDESNDEEDPQAQAGEGQNQGESEETEGTGEESGDGPELRDEEEKRHGIQLVKNAGNTKDKAYIDWTNEEYIFHLKDQPVFNIPFVRVQRICEWYVYGGGGLTQKQVCREYFRHFESRLTHDYLRRMLKAIDVDKNATPHAPHQIEDSTVDENVKTWREREEALIETKYRAKEAKNWKRKFTRIKKKIMSYEEHFEEAYANIRERGYQPVWEVTPTEPNEDGSISPIMLFGDWHIGKDEEIEENIFNQDVARRRVEQLATEIISFFRAYDRPIDQMHVVLLGDMIDGVYGDMHDQQHLHQDLNGAEQMERAAELMAGLLKVLFEELEMAGMTVHAVVGNHGRSRKSNKQDPQRLPEVATYNYARMMSDERIEWNISTERTATFKVRTTKVIATHGDRKPRKIRDLAWSHREAGVEHYLVVSGHKHSDQVDGATDHVVMHVRNGSLCGVSSYARDELAKLSRASQCFVEIHDDGPRHGRTFYLT